MRAQERNKNAGMLEQQIAEWDRINTKRKMVILSLPRDAHNEPNLAKAPAGIKILIREMMQPKPYFPKVDGSLLEDEKVATAWYLRLFLVIDVFAEHCGAAACVAAAAILLAPSLQTIQLCHEIIKTEYAVLAAPVETPVRLKPTIERRSKKKDNAQGAAELP